MPMRRLRSAERGELSRLIKPDAASGRLYGQLRVDDWDVVSAERCFVPEIAAVSSRARETGCTRQRRAIATAESSRKCLSTDAYGEFIEPSGARRNSAEASTLRGSGGIKNSVPDPFLPFDIPFHI